MTPEREKYLASISRKERAIRSAIRTNRLHLSDTKDWWKRHQDNPPNKIRGYKWVIKWQKITLMACKRELARLKGMDNVVVPYKLHSTYTSRDGVSGYVTNGECICGEAINSYDHKYCPECGKRILWEKVK